MGRDARRGRYSPASRGHDRSVLSPAYHPAPAIIPVAAGDSLESVLELVRTSEADDIVLELESGTTVRWGDARESMLKAQVSETLRTGKNQTIDVSAPHTPAVR